MGIIETISAGNRATQALAVSRDPRVAKSLRQGWRLIQAANTGTATAPLGRTASYLGLSPRRGISGGMKISPKNGKAKRRLATALRMSASFLLRSKG